VGSGEVDTGAAPGGPIRRISRTEALKAHVTLAIGLALCAFAFWFEIRRALGGNALSWAYVWWNVLHPERLVRRMSKKKVAVAPEFDGMLTAWRKHQEELSLANETPSPSERDSQ
jgi:hypothetical protein